MPPVGIPLDCLDPTLDIPSESSRRALIFDHSLRPLEAFTGTSLGLQGKEEAVAVRLFARWARLFRWEALRHCVGVEFGAPHL